MSIVRVWILLFVSFLTWSSECKNSGKDLRASTSSLLPKFSKSCSSTSESEKQIHEHMREFFWSFLSFPGFARFLSLGDTEFVFCIFFRPYMFCMIWFHLSCPHLSFPILSLPGTIEKASREPNNEIERTKVTVNRILKFFSLTKPRWIFLQKNLPHSLSPPLIYCQGIVPHEFRETSHPWTGLTHLPARIHYSMNSALR